MAPITFKMIDRAEAAFLKHPDLDKKFKLWWRLAAPLHTDVCMDNFSYGSAIPFLYNQGCEGDNDAKGIWNELVQRVNLEPVVKDLLPLFESVADE